MTRFIILFALLIAVWTGGRPAFGHAELLETNPASGSVLDGAPREIVLRFNETVTPIALTLIGRDGSTTLVAMAHDTSIHADLPGPLPDGTYIVSYRAVSADSHPIGGAFPFSVGTPSATAPSVPVMPAAEDADAILVIVNRILLLGSLFFSAGGVLFAAGVLGMNSSVVPLHRPLRLGAALAIASALLAIVLQGALLTGAALTDAAAWRDGTILRIGWQSSLGRSVTIIGLGLLLIVAFFHPGKRYWLRPLSIAGAALAIGALAMSGHAMTASPRWLAVTVMALHGLTLGFWIGSLWPLLRCLELPAGQAARIMARFSDLAVTAVAVLIATGLILAILNLGGNIAALLNTPYGQLLLLKLALVALLLLLATYNKFRLTPALTRGERDAAARLGRAIRLEIAAIGLIVAIAVLLGQTPPHADAAGERATTALHAGHLGHPAIVPQAAAQSTTAESKGYVAVITLAPAQVGRNTLSVALRTPEGAPFDALEVTAEFSLASAGIEPLAEPLRHVAAGRYELTTDALIQPGLWQASLTVLVNSFERVHFDVGLTVSAR